MPRIASAPRSALLKPTAINTILAEVRQLWGVAVIHGSASGTGGEGTLRVSSASGGDTLTDGLERLRKGLSRL